MGNCQCIERCREPGSLNEDLNIVNPDHIYLTENKQSSQQSNKLSSQQQIPSLQNMANYNQEISERHIKLQSDKQLNNDMTMGIKLNTIPSSGEHQISRITLNRNSLSQSKNIQKLKDSSNLFGLISQQVDSEKNIEIFENNIEFQQRFDAIDNCNKIVNKSQNKLKPQNNSLKTGNHIQKQFLLNQQQENDKFLDQQILRNFDSNINSQEIQYHEPTSDFATQFQGKLETIISKQASEVLHNLPIFEVGILPTDSFASHIYYSINNTGNIYIGQWRKGFMNGHGKMYLKNGGVYEGNFFENEILGEGRMVFTNGDYYCGGFKNGLPDQSGRYNYQNGDVYEGEYKIGQRHGKGSFSNKNNSEIYKGYYVGDKRQGTGELLIKDIYKYQGEFSNDKLNGKGTCEWFNKKIYNGAWKDNNMNGYGELKWFSGKFYRGQFVNNLFEGKGMFFHNDSTEVYNGEWKSGKKHGQGVISYPNGQKYKVEYLYDKEYSRQSI